jgi:hypothetical protein
MDRIAAMILLLGLVLVSPQVAHEDSWSDSHIYYHSISHLLLLVVLYFYLPFFLPINATYLIFY